MVVAVPQAGVASVAAEQAVAAQVAVARWAGFRLQAAPVVAQFVMSLAKPGKLVSSAPPELVANWSLEETAVLRVVGRPVATVVLQPRFAAAREVRAARAVGRQIAVGVVVLGQLEAEAEPGG